MMKMSFEEDHLKTCDYCQKSSGFSGSSTKSGSFSATFKPTITVKSAASRERERKLIELGALIKGTSYPSLSPMLQTKGASVVGNNIPSPRKQGPIEKEIKLRALGKMIRGY